MATPYPTPVPTPTPKGVGGAYPIAGGYQYPSQPTPTPVPTPTQPTVLGTSTNTSGVGGAYPIAGGYTAPTTNNNTAPSNNNGGMSIREQMEKGLIPWNDNILNAGNGVPSGPSEADLNAVYDPSMGYLNQAQGAAESGYADVQKQAEADFQTLYSELGGNKQKNLTTIAANKVTVGNVKEDALAAARRLYDQLRRGYQQRFGGSTSAGGAASEIASAEQQRQQGGVQRDYGTTMREIESQKTQLESDYQTGLLKLQASKQQALSTANQDFQNKLLQISQNRAQVESAKAQARLQALHELRNQVYTINQQQVQFQQTLEAQRQAAMLDLQNYTAKFNVAGGAAGTAASNFQPSVSSNLQVQNSNQQTQSNPYVGSMTSQDTSGLTPYARKLLEDQKIVKTGI